MNSFKSIKVGEYFVFEGMEHQIRKKVSAKKYIWISDGDVDYCRNTNDEIDAPTWETKKRHIEKCNVVQFSYK